MSDSPYSAEKLISQARTLAAEYRRAMGRPLPGISNEIAAHDAVRLLQLVPAEEKEVSYDAIDPASGKKIQIKSRTVFDEQKGGQRIGQLKIEKTWDAVVLVLMNEHYEPVEIYQAERADLEQVVDKASASRAKRGAVSLARFKIIGRLVWDKDNGLQTGVWSNQE